MVAMFEAAIADGASSRADRARLCAGREKQRKFLSCRMILLEAGLHAYQ
jgi:hypothetical protein